MLTHQEGFREALKGTESSRSAGSPKTRTETKRKWIMMVIPGVSS